MTNMALQFMHATCNLVKLTIEGERRCGDRGMVILLKHLQYNTSLKSLTLRDCGLSSRTAAACGRYVGVTQSLQCLNVNDNQFSSEDVLCIVRAMATRGAKGSLDTVMMKDQFPPLTGVVIRSIHQYATALGVQIEADSGSCLCYSYSSPADRCVAIVFICCYEFLCETIWLSL